MPWFRLDDSFDTHPKVLMAGNEAVGLYIRCGTYAARNLTDGFVGQEIVLLYGSDSLAATLVRVGLWHRARGGWNIHDYLDYNPSREEVLAKRKIRSEAGRAGGVASGKARSKPEANRSSSVQPPARPDPYVSGTGFSSASGRARPQVQASSKTPSSRPVEQALRLPPGYEPATADSVHSHAEAARQALNRKREA